MGIGNGDEPVGHRGQESVQAAHAIGPTRGMECRKDDGNSNAVRRKPSPEHFVAGTDGDDDVSATLMHQPCQTRQHTDIPFAVQKICVHRELVRDLLPQRSRVLQTDDFGTDHAVVHPTHHVHQ